MLRSLLLITLLLLTHPVPAERVFLGPAPYLPEEERNYVEEAGKGEDFALDVDVSDRASVVAFHQAVYEPGIGADPKWAGNINTCITGMTSALFRDQVLLRVNYYRAMVGLPPVETLVNERNEKCQDAALMMIAKPGLSHSPGIDWPCYTDNGKEAAGKSNLALGNYGTSAVDAYIEDNGANNEAVGHRRWILYPRLTSIGTGDLDASNGYYHGANALWVIDDFGSRPASPEWVAWPPAGYVPWSLVCSRWSFSCSGASFSGAKVTVTGPDGPVDIQVYSVHNGYGDNTLVWEIRDSLPTRPEEDQVYSVAVENVDGSRDYSYQVIIIDPDQVPPTVTPTPSPAPEPTGTPTPVPAGPADTTRDGRVDFRDLFNFILTWDDESGAPSYDPDCDLETDQRIDGSDVLRYLIESRDSPSR